MGKHRIVSYRQRDRWTGQPASASHCSARPFVPLFLAATLVWTVSLQGAQSDAARRTAPATRSKTDKAPLPAAKRTADATSVRVPSTTASTPKIVAHLPVEGDSNAVLTDHLRTQLWQSRILPPDPNEDADTKAALQSLIQRLKTAGADRQTNEPARAKPIVIEPATAASRQAGPAAPVPAESPGTAAARPGAEPNGTLSQVASERLNHLVKDPNQVHDPLELAELLFLNNHLREAAVLYEKALTLTVPNDPATSDDRAWILFQLGTSLRQTDATKARDAYLKLISEFPNSPWTELAKANGRLINWYETAKPQQLMSSPTRE
jgi:hypothetical protein